VVLPQTPDQEFGLPDRGDAPDAADELVAPLIDGVFAYQPLPQEGLVAVKEDGRVVAVKNGKVDVLSGSPVSEIQGVYFSHDGGYVLVIFGPRYNSEASIFNIKDKVWQPLAGNISAASWSPSDSRLVYASSDEGGLNILLKNAGDLKSKPKNISTFHVRDIKLSWFSEDKIYIQELASGLATGSAWIIDPVKNTVFVTLQDRLGLEVIWSQYSGRGLAWISDAAERGGELLLIDSRGGGLRGFSFVSLPDKCVFYKEDGRATSTQDGSGPEYLYCAIPKDQRSAKLALMPDEYYQGVLITSDDLFRINLDTGDMQVVPGDLPQAPDIRNLKIKNNQVYLLERFSGGVYALPALP